MSRTLGIPLDKSTACCTTYKTSQCTELEVRVFLAGRGASLAGDLLVPRGPQLQPLVLTDAEEMASAVAAGATRGLLDAPRLGVPPTITDGDVERVIRKRWTNDTMRRRIGVRG